ncbi:hypothetical protein [Rhodococcus sp. MALMAid1271]|uniref:hypothetical protein n=1 Tax=Rhodococcus sp. MALMAid1271 TaxID=3411744 RepID=UPI003B9FFE3F
MLALSAILIGTNAFGNAPSDDLLAGNAPDAAQLAEPHNADDLGENTDTGNASVTKCSSEPTFTPTKVTSAGGSLEVTMFVAAQCADGDVLSSSRTRITLSQAGSDVASAIFDLSRSPLYVPADESQQSAATRVFRFPIGSFWRTPESLTSSGYFVDTEESGVQGPQSGEVSETTPPIDAVAAAAPEYTDADSASATGLRAIADTDKPMIIRDVGERWVPQLSSKRNGLVAEGITWNSSEILRDHLELRSRFPQVKLMWSAEWNVFSYDDFWVTIAGIEFSTPDAANNWCSSNGLSRDNCLAKLVSETHPVEGSTVTR